MPDAVTDVARSRPAVRHIDGPAPPGSRTRPHRGAVPPLAGFRQDTRHCSFRKPRSVRRGRDPVVYPGGAPLGGVGPTQSPAEGQPEPEPIPASKGQVPAPWPQLQMNLR